jgi:hypothetical protein
VEVVELLEVESSLEVELLEEASLTFNTQS